MISTILTTLLALDAIILIFLIVVFQQGPEGGIGSTMGGGGNTSGFFGAAGTTKPIVRATWICAVLFFVLGGSAAWVTTHRHYAATRSIQKMLQENPGKSNKSIPKNSKPSTSSGKK